MWWVHILDGHPQLLLRRLREQVLQDKLRVLDLVLPSDELDGCLHDVVVALCWWWVLTLHIYNTSGYLFSHFPLPYHTSYYYCTYKHWDYSILSFPAAFCVKEETHLVLTSVVYHTFLSTSSSCCTLLSKNSSCSLSMAICMFFSSGNAVPPLMVRAGLAQLPAQSDKMF